MSQIPAKGWPFDGPGGNMELEATFPCPEATALGLFASNLQEIPCWLETNISATNSIFEPMMVRTFRWDMDWFPRPVLINIRFLSPIKFSRKLPLKLSMSVSRLDLFQASKHLQFSPGSSFRFGWFDPRPSVVFWGNHHRGSMPTFGASEDFGCFVVWDPQGFRGAGTSAAWGFFAFSWLLLIMPISCLMQR